MPWASLFRSRRFTSGMDPPSVRFRVSAGTAFGTKQVTLTYFPAVVVQNYDAEFLKERTGAIAQAMSGLFEDIEGLKERTGKAHQDMQKITQQLRDSALQNTSADATSSASVNLDQSGTPVPERRDDGMAAVQSTLKDTEATQKLVEALANVYSNDLASFVFVDTLASATMQSTIGIRHKFSSAQKKTGIEAARTQPWDKPGRSRTAVDGRLRVGA